MEPEKNFVKPMTYGTAVPCPVCQSVKGRVVDKRNRSDSIFRRRQCENGHRFNTIEKIDVRKSETDTSGENFEQNLKNALQQAIDYKKLAKLIFVN